MKITNLFLLLCTLSFFVACDKEDEINCTDLSEVVVGTWESSLLGAGTFEFAADGTLNDPNDLIISGELNGEVLDEKSWTVTGNILEVEARKGSQFLSSEFDVASFDCDRITIEFLGVAVVMNRQ